MHESQPLSSVVKAEPEAQRLGDFPIFWASEKALLQLE